MNKKRPCIFICLSIYLLLCFHSCKSPFGEVTIEGDIIKGTGTITYIEVEGGFYGIVTANNGHYDPINLSPEFKVNGLRVEFNAKIRKDLGSYHMWGTIIELTYIKKLD